VCKNGKAGVNGEHTPQDAPAPARVCDIALGLESVEQYTQLLEVEDDSNIAAKRLSFDVSGLDKGLFDKAKQNVANLIDSVEITIRDFNSFGAYVGGSRSTHTCWLAGWLAGWLASSP
jgi:hypothetical protein